MQVVLHRLDDVRHRVEADHVRGAERARLRAAQLLAGEVVDYVVAQAELLGFGRSSPACRKMPTRLAMKFGVSFARTTPLPSALVTKVSSWSRISGCVVGGRDQLDQVHVARRVEEVHAAEARLQIVSGSPSDSFVIDRPEVLRREDRVRRDVRRDLLVQVVLPVHALGDGFDDEVASGELLDVVLVVGGLDALRVVLACRAAPATASSGSRSPSARCRSSGLPWRAGRTAATGHLGVDQVRGDLRAHHAGAEHGDLANDQIAHVVTSGSRVREAMGRCASMPAELAISTARRMRDALPDDRA